ncbi:MAG: hypothetical protein ACRDRJ_12740 [Streptosporangiaceae bacterium]
MPQPASAANGPRTGTRVRVPCTLHTGGFSIVNPATGRVGGRAADITLTGVQFRVQPAALARIRATGHRQACAYATGLVAAASTTPDLAGLPKVTFNPYRAPTFTAGAEPVHAAPAVIFAAAAGCLLPGPARGA